MWSEAAKEEEGNDDDMDGFQSDEEEEDEVSDKEMGDDGDDGDEADSIKLQRLAAQAKVFQSDDDDDDSDDDDSDDEELHSPIDDVDPFVLFVDTMKVVQVSDPARFQGLMQTLDFRYTALASGVAQHAEQRRAEIEKERLENAAGAS